MIYITNYRLKTYELLEKIKILINLKINDIVKHFFVFFSHEFDEK